LVQSHQGPGTGVGDEPFVEDDRVVADAQLHAHALATFPVGFEVDSFLPFSGTVDLIGLSASGFVEPSSFNLVVRSFVYVAVGFSFTTTFAYAMLKVGKIVIKATAHNLLARFSSDIFPPFWTQNGRKV
jgi:hypothetical protein